MSRSPTPAVSLVKLAGDFTLGFADGLTVPFALTAGMSFLGRSDAVILAGLAELCAGSISMGIGGFLAMRDTQREEDNRQAAADEEMQSPSSRQRRRRQRRADEADAEAATGLLSNPDEGSSERSSVSSLSVAEGNFGEKSTTVGDVDGSNATDEEIVRRHLAPLQLPESTLQHILATMQIAPSPINARPATPSNLDTETPVQQRLAKFYHSIQPPSDEYLDDAGYDSTHHPQPQPRKSTLLAPLISGLTIAMGYIIGGLIPLLPYFFAGSVEAGTRWSIGLCMLALFAFGAGKYWLLQGLSGADEERMGNGDEQRLSSVLRLEKLRSCLFEGVQMLVLGMVAAGAAVLCVRVVNDGGSGV